MRISDWSSDVCSSDLLDRLGIGRAVNKRAFLYLHLLDRACWPLSDMLDGKRLRVRRLGGEDQRRQDQAVGLVIGRSEEHTSELQSLMRISYAVFCLKKKKL